MIRIDEIYENTIWPWLKRYHPGVRLWWCEPFGSTNPDSLFNYGNDGLVEHNYILMWDQEPIHLNIHLPTFEKCILKNFSLHLTCNHRNDMNKKYKELVEDTSVKTDYQVGAIVTSEHKSEFVDAVCKKFNWKQYYYFFHGWAALDWYRGYNKTFLITPWQQRKVKKTFLSPNRIIAGARQHRLEMLYWIFKMNMANNHISCPSVCPAENITIEEATKSLVSKYPDIEEIFSSQTFPINFVNETGHPMHSCWLSLFDESAESMLYLVTETVATGRRHHLTEKTFKPIAMGMPFIIVGTQGSLQYLRSYGFKTFGDLWDESYDDEPDDSLRIEKIAKVLKLLEGLDEDRQTIFESAWPIIEHNWNHFYGGGFEEILWQELQAMLNDLEFDSGPNNRG